ncbi:ceroid-lipofuscinosis neuronal protein 5 [Biomphalaria glabrata]|uniref:Bis(monoacylglycero)phosphate synthase CLN5 n=1 Tax=Biomphalaria glabrata TaxID=6526 RepID=A0A2C9K4R7_BIOGL|nr:ceroid-lipofuscinosis neuronal protein 5-like [Biomphalaria glabrata]XP_055893351.1 ceroid-lipofuscinosis neuronal protein 5-like [Biomphalaria glabrata]XP_055893352.1 ceroid-lipofuscinosis neuronal protein 5-like [Biomphalaria glabrata]XP_055893353.1 ceroid-lipofuscinosis neuronal protein 5-like [Biomphalaria glabrata]KAI8727441.1 ceroid-lipofuscinosis neuronal protein 5-like [Biomphalaria glabrata]
MKWLLALVYLILFVQYGIGWTSQCSDPHPLWPQIHREYEKRPISDPYCKAGIIPFCPTGLPSNSMPKVGDSDLLYVYAMKAPVWEFKFGDLLKKFNIMHDAIGFHHVPTGLNMTMEWYELFQLFNCTFPHERKVEQDLMWCNQGAACIYMGIDEKHWKENGTLVKVGEINGTIFNQFAMWTELDNNTFPFYETWTVKESRQGVTWFDPFDCASWVLRAFSKLHEYGATFNTSVHLNYTKAVLYSDQPMCIGNATTVYQNVTIINSLKKFYSYFQGSQNLAEVLLHLLEYLPYFLMYNNFYLYYNDEYWHLPLKYPYIEITYDEVPLPS